MQMRAPLQIQSMIKAMTDVVLPALDPQNKLAQEQARLVVGLLGLMSKQLPLQFRFDCDELQRLIAFSESLQRLAQGGPDTTAAVAQLAERTSSAKHDYERGTRSPANVEQQVRDLRSLSGTVVTAVFSDGVASCRKSVQNAVLEMSKTQLLRDRAWVVSQGWEPDPKAVPAIESLLAPVFSSAN